MGHTLPDLRLQLYGANDTRWNKLDLNNVEKVLSRLLIMKCNLWRGREEGRGKGKKGISINYIDAVDV